MDIDGCEFPDDLLYDPDALMWARAPADGVVTIGVTSLHAALGGRLVRVRGRAVGADYARGATIGTIESGKYFGPLRAPVGGTLLEVNEEVVRRPKALSEAPYGAGWFARLRPARWEADASDLQTASASADLFRRQKAALRVRCFAAFPDHEMFEIGTECAAVLVKLGELLRAIPSGEVVHVVSDDPTAPIEMTRWSEQTGHPIIEARQEGTLFHFLVRKA